MKYISILDLTVSDKPSRLSIPVSKEGYFIIKNLTRLFNDEFNKLSNKEKEEFRDYKGNPFDNNITIRDETPKAEEPISVDVDYLKSTFKSIQFELNGEIIEIGDGASSFISWEQFKVLADTVNFMGGKIKSFIKRPMKDS